MELREIEVFLVLAEELHFGRTAERLYVSQSRVSQVIRLMETRVGGRLFERTSRRVRLTPLGAQLRDALAPPYEQIHQALAAATQVSSEISGELRISALSFAAAGPAFAGVVRAFRARHRSCEVTVYEAFPGEVLQRLRDGELDMLAHWLPVDQPDLVVGPVLTRAERALAVQLGHSLAERGWATLEDLADNAIVDADGVVPPETLAALYPSRTPSGRTIPRRFREGRMVEVLGLVARGEVVHPTVVSLSDYYTHPGVTTIPLRDLPPVESALVWSRRHETAAVRAFAELAQELAAPAGA